MRSRQSRQASRQDGGTNQCRQAIEFVDSAKAGRKIGRRGAKGRWGSVPDEVSKPIIRSGGSG